MRQSLGAIIAVAISVGVRCDTHYVARPETNPWVRPAYPYTSPETATPYIMDAMYAADPGDTVSVLPGTYGWDGATYRVKSGVDLAGSGRELTTMLGRVQVGQGSMVAAMRFLDTGVFASSGGIIDDCLFERASVGTTPPATVRRCAFIGASGNSESAVSGMYGGGLSIVDCVFDLAEEADGVHVWNVQERGGLMVERCRFTGCGTAIRVADSRASIENSLFVRNELGVDTGILDLTIENCTFYGNDWAITSSVRGYLQSVKNSILWANRSGNILETPKEYKGEIYMPVITFSDVEGGYPGRGNIDADPMFLSPWLGADLHLYWGSPCVDAGDPFSDYSNEPQPNGARVNMGAYGNTWQATTSELVDTDGDNLRDDWEIKHFGSLDPDGSGDADHDGLGDRGEYRYLSDPNNPDTDGDGLLDGEEVRKYGTDPLLADTDNDGTPDAKEVAQGTNPLDPWDAFTIIKFWIEEGYLYVTFPTLPGYRYSLESSNWPNGPFGFTVDPYTGRYGVLTHTHVLRLGPYNRFFRIKAREYPGGEGLR